MPDGLSVVNAVLRDGNTVQIEVARGEELVASRTYAFSGVSQKISTLAGELADLLRDVRPDVASIELGFEVGLEQGNLTAILVRGTSKANLKITLEWHRSPPGAEYPIQD